MSALSARFRDVTVTVASESGTGPGGPSFLASSERVGSAPTPHGQPTSLNLPPDGKETASAAAGPIPSSWLLLQHAGHTFRFVHTHADTEPLEEQVRTVFPSATAIDAEPMTLRSIFLAIAKSGRAIDHATTSEGVSR
jgi:hypothetical protein